MGYGSRSRKRPEISALVLGACLVAVSCGTGARFDRALSKLDAALASGEAGAIGKAFEGSYRRASSAGDWLSILKRARALEPRGGPRSIEAAERASKAGGASENLVAARAYAFLRSGEYRKALALFGSGLDPSRYRDLWTAAFVAAARSGKLPSAEPEDFSRLSEILDDPAPLAGAAALELARGDRAGAAAAASRAYADGLELPASILWDCGLYEMLATSSRVSAEEGLGAVELSIMGDAAWASGDPALARERWESAIMEDPSASWKPYAKLAYAEPDRARAESYWLRMRAAFVDSPRPSASAAVAYASSLLAEGRGARASAVLASFEGDPAARALALRALAAGDGAAALPEGRLASEALRLAAEGDERATGYALAILFEHGRFEDMIALFDSAEDRGTGYPDRWFYKAATAAASGDFAAAAEAASGTDAAGAPEADLALGIALRAQGRSREALAPLARASAALAGPGPSCSALKELGNALRETGDLAGAVKAFSKAAAADPGDSEAAQLARAARAP